MPSDCLFVPAGVVLSQVKRREKVVDERARVCPLLFLDWGPALHTDVQAGGRGGLGAAGVARAYADLLLPVVEGFGAGVVLSGERRKRMPLAMFAAEFGVLAPHVVGVTPRLQGDARGLREREIEAYLAGRGAEASLAWVAVDATVNGFVRHRRHLFGLRRDRGLQARDIDSLKRRLARLVDEARRRRADED